MAATLDPFGAPPIPSNDGKGDRRREAVGNVETETFDARGDYRGRDCSPLS
jgi:hypothetical protein